jgi:large subunit ribosomal protein L7Ae
LVVIANNVDPIELVVWLPNLLRKLEIPYCFVKGKAALGRLVHQKNAAVVALTEVRKEDEAELNNLAAAFRTHFNENK